MLKAEHNILTGVILMFPLLAFSSSSQFETWTSKGSSFDLEPSNVARYAIFDDIARSRQVKQEQHLVVQDYRERLKQHLSFQLNTKWQLGLDSFKASPIEKQLINWPKSTEPKENCAPTQRGYGVGIRMKLD